MPKIGQFVHGTTESACFSGEHMEFTAEDEAELFLNLSSGFSASNWIRCNKECVSQHAVAEVLRAEPNLEEEDVEEHNSEFDTDFTFDEPDYLSSSPKFRQPISSTINSAIFHHSRTVNVLTDRKQKFGCLKSKNGSCCSQKGVFYDDEAKKLTYKLGQLSRTWRPVGSAECRSVYIAYDCKPFKRLCYCSIKHKRRRFEIFRRDCVVVKAGDLEAGDLPYVGKIYDFFVDPALGILMMSILWYYYPSKVEITSLGGSEILASRHLDVIPVDCIEDRCCVLTLNEYNRYMLQFKADKDSVLFNERRIATVCYASQERNFPDVTVSPEFVFYCCRVYDFHRRRILKNPIM